MRSLIAYQFFFLFHVLIVKVSAVTHGYEQYGNLPGYFYVFSSTATSIIDPIYGTINNTISGGVTSYGDAVYIEDQAELKHYVFIAQSAANKVAIYDADTQSLVTMVSVGQRPLHMYSLYYYDEVWVHLDLEGSFDVFRMAQVRQRTTSGVKSDSANIGHGKLMFDPNLEDTAFATNVNEAAIFRLSLTSRTFTEKIAIKSNNTAFTCAGTHGIEYSSVNNRVYAECSNPKACVSPYKNATACKGSIWTVDAPTGAIKARLFSPDLSARYGAEFGIQGQPYRSPESTFILVPNKNLNILHFLQPTSRTTHILELNLSKPGNIEFWPKNSALTFGLDSNASNYVMVIPVTEGVAFLDMSHVVKAFAENATVLSKSFVTILPIANGGTSRTIVRGGDYIMTPVYSSGATVSTEVVLINVKLRTVAHTVSIPNALKWLWVPIQVNEVAAQIKTLKAQVVTLSATAAQSSSSQLENENIAHDGIIVGSIGISLAFLALTLMLIMYFNVNCFKAKDTHEKEYLSQEQSIM